MADKEATKHDSEKVRFDLVPVRALESVADVFTYGAVGKPNPDGTSGYGVGNWKQGKGFKWSRLIRPCFSHLTAFMRGENLDPESGKPHLAHLACCVLMLLEHYLTKHGDDDRADAQILDIKQ